jgi:D-alanyl-D-alanine carboxypeptidase (penicillin-binding protein 5/6)
VKKDDIVDEVKVHKGVKSKIPMIVSEDVNDLVKKNEVKEYSYKVNKLDVKAPINKGDVIGSLEVLDNDGKVVRKIDLVSNVRVKKQSFLSLFKKFFFKYIRGY